MFPDFLDKTRQHFVKVKAFSPEASRKQSAEIYVIGRQMLTGAVQINDEYTVTIEEIGVDGDGIAKIGEFVVFVRDAKEGEKLKIRIRSVRPNFAFGDRIQ